MRCTTLPTKLLSSNLRPGEYPGILSAEATPAPPCGSCSSTSTQGTETASPPSPSTTLAQPPKPLTRLPTLYGLTVDGIVGRTTWEFSLQRGFPPAAVRAGGHTEGACPAPSDPLTGQQHDCSTTRFFCSGLPTITRGVNPPLSSHTEQPTLPAAPELLGLPATGIADAGAWTAVEALSLQLAAYTPNPDRDGAGSRLPRPRHSRGAAPGRMSCKLSSGSMAGPTSIAARTM